MQLKIRVNRVKSGKQIFIPFDIKIGMKSALHQNARAAERNRFVNPFADFFKRMNISVRLSRAAIKRAECADDVADVCVIDVAINDIRYNVTDFFRIRISCAATPILSIS